MIEIAAYRCEDGTPSHVSLLACFDTLDPAAASALIALFPKSAKLSVSTLSGTPAGTVSTVRGNAVLRSNEVNDGVNETGVKRYRTWIKAAEKAGVQVTWKSINPWLLNAGNAYETRESFEAAL